MNADKVIAEYRKAYKAFYGPQAPLTMRKQITVNINGHDASLKRVKELTEQIKEHLEKHPTLFNNN